MLKLFIVLSLTCELYIIVIIYYYMWQHRKLGFIGKVTVIKAFALSKLVDAFTVLPNPLEKVIEDIVRNIFLYL